MWKQVIDKSPAKHMAFIAHSYGGVCTLELVSKAARCHDESSGVTCEKKKMEWSKSNTYNRIGKSSGGQVPRSRVCLGDDGFRPQHDTPWVNRAQPAAVSLSGRLTWKVTLVEGSHYLFTSPQQSAAPAEKRISSGAHNLSYFLCRGGIDLRGPLGRQLNANV